MRWAAVGTAGPAAAGRYMLPLERYLVSTRQHPAVLIGPSVLALAWLVAAVILSVTVLGGQADLIWAVWLAWLVLILRAIWKAANWTADFLVVTSRRFLIITGLLSKKVATIPLEMVNDMTFQRSVGGRWFGYGDFIVEYGAPDQITQKIEYLPNPAALYLKVCDVVFAGDRVPCPRCHGEGAISRHPDEQAGPPDETGDDRVADLVTPLEDGAREILCPTCGGWGVVAQQS